MGEELPGRVLGLALKAPEGGRCFGEHGVPGNGQLHPQVRSSLAPLFQGAAVSGWRAGRKTKCAFRVVLQIWGVTCLLVPGVGSDRR